MSTDGRSPQLFSSVFCAKRYQSSVNTQMPLVHTKGIRILPMPANWLMSRKDLAVFLSGFGIARASESFISGSLLDRFDFLAQRFTGIKHLLPFCSSYGSISVDN